MKNLIFAIILFVFTGCIITESSHAQDVFGRAKRTDTTYLDAADFNPGEVIAVDTSGGQSFFVGTDIASVLNQPDRVVFIILDTNASGNMAHRVLYSTLADTTFTIASSGSAVYEVAYGSTVFSGKRITIKNTPSSTILTGDIFDPSLTVKGYLHVPIAETTLSSFFFMTTDSDGLVSYGILQPNTIFEITIYPQ